MELRTTPPWAPHAPALSVSGTWGGNPPDPPLEVFPWPTMKVKVTQSCPTLCNPLSMGFSRQECWNGLPFPSPGDLSDPGVKLASFTSTALAGRYICGP